MALAANPNDLTERPDGEESRLDLLAEALRRVRITDSMQYCFMPSGDWIADATPSPYKPPDCIGFHIMAGGEMWLDLDGERTTLIKGDIAAFPFGTPHWIGSGAGGPQVVPGGDLPAAPWTETPMLHYGGGERQVRVLCGYIQSEMMEFAPFRSLLPRFIHVRTSDKADDWLAATLDQIVTEVDRPKRGGASVLERLTEVTFLEVLRRQLLEATPAETGWLAAIHDPAVGRCLQAIHEAPYRDWTVAALGKEAGLSRSALASRFSALLEISPINYVRDWRLYLASIQLPGADRSIADIAFEAGYQTEASFNRAFARRYAKPPAQWRQAARRRQS